MRLARLLDELGSSIGAPESYVCTKQHGYEAHVETKIWALKGMIKPWQHTFPKKLRRVQVNLGTSQFPVFSLQPGQKVGVFKSTTAAGFANESTCRMGYQPFSCKKMTNSAILRQRWKFRVPSVLFLDVSGVVCWCCWTFLGSAYQLISFFWIISLKRFSPQQNPAV